MLLGDDQPQHETPWLTIGLITVCTVVYLAQIGGALPDASQRFGVIPALITGAVPEFPHQNNGWITLFTSGFLHGNEMHLVGNMIFLWIFGNNVEDSFGRLWMAFFVIICEAAANFTHIVLGPDVLRASIGASGFISGIMGAYIVLFPNAKLSIFTVRVTFELPAWLWIGFWAISQGLSFWFDPRLHAGVGYAAHLGGFAMGAVLSLTLHRFGIIATYANAAALVPRKVSESERQEFAFRQDDAKRALLIGRLTLALIAIVVVLGELTYLAVARSLNLKHFLKEAAAGNAQASGLAANGLLARNGAAALDQAVALYRKAAVDGDKPSAAKMADINWEGRIGNVDAPAYLDRANAIESDFAAAVSGDDDRLIGLAVKLADDPSVAPHRISFALAQLERIAKISSFERRNRVGLAQSVLALYHARGIGTARDPRTARFWLDSARRKGVTGLAKIVEAELEKPQG